MMMWGVKCHMASTCCYYCFCRYLIEHGANVGAVNSEGELPLDVATEDAMERLLKAEIKKQGKVLYLFVYLLFTWASRKSGSKLCPFCISAP